MAESEQHSSAMPEITESQGKQWAVENDVFQIYRFFSSSSREDQDALLKLRRDNHIEYLNKGLRQLPASFCTLDANRPWLCYWIVHSLALLGESIDDADLEDNAIDFLSRCQDQNGGYGGGPGQLPHLATTYAAVNSLITIGGEKALSSINREKLYKFLLRMKVASGGFSMHDGGEVDVRACYTAISVASVLNIMDDDLVQDVGNFVLSCQTYEGGIAGEPGAEAHGGYSFCGLATLALINEVQRLDLPRFIDWLVFRQGVEGGFQGRTNKLVDGCYSFWQGGAFPLLQRLGSVVNEQLGIGTEEHTSISTEGVDSPDLSEDDPDHEGTSSQADKHFHPKGKGQTSDRSKVSLSDIGAEFLERNMDIPPLLQSAVLQDYILLCCQVPQGGLKDKPREHRDFYHTCYCLSGLSVCQHIWSKSLDSPPLPWAIRGPYSNLLEPIHPLYNVILDKYHEAHDFFSASEL
uniref:Protein farnesyltransferase subunit beta n=1 Tax=Kalanchoe fedtschenkoi TaxID=63787 RepID=A0A7N1A0S1_KALFE